MIRQIILIFIILFSFTGISILQVESVIITPFHFFSLIVLIFTALASRKIPSTIKYPLILLLLLIITLLINIGTEINVNTYIHSLFYILIYSLVLLNLKSFSIEVCMVATKFIITIYFIVVIIALLCVKLNINSSTVNLYLGILFDLKTSEYRYYGFSSEPSYLAIIISFCMFFLFTINKIRTVKNLNLYFALYVITIIISTSAYGLFFILFFVAFEYGSFIKRNKFVLLSISVVILFYIIMNYQFDSRIFQIFKAIFSSNSIDSKLTAWRIVDSSSYYRVGPLVWMLDNIDFLSIKTYLGHGMGSDREYFQKFGEGYGGGYLNLGFIPAFIYTNGILSLILILTYLVSLIRKINVFYLYFMFFIVLFNCNFTTQIFWFLTSLLTILAKLRVNENAYKKYYLNKSLS